MGKYVHFIVWIVVKQNWGSAWKLSLREFFPAKKSKKSLLPVIVLVLWVSNSWGLPSSALRNRFESVTLLRFASHDKEKRGKRRGIFAESRKGIEEADIYFQLSHFLLLLPFFRFLCMWGGKPVYVQSILEPPNTWFFLLFLSQGKESDAVSLLRFVHGERRGGEKKKQGNFLQVRRRHTNSQPRTIFKKTGTKREEPGVPVTQKCDFGADTPRSKPLYFQNTFWKKLSQILYTKSLGPGISVWRSKNVWTVAEMPCRDSGINLDDPPMDLAADPTHTKNEFWQSEQARQLPAVTKAFRACVTVCRGEKSVRRHRCVTDESAR